MNRRLFLLIPLLAAACARPAARDPQEGVVNPRVRAEGVDLGPFDSDVLKISWFRVVPVMEPSPGERVQGVVERGAPEYLVIYSHGWLRRHGLRTREPLIKNIAMLNWGYSPEGVTNDDARHMAGFLIQHGLLSLPEAGPELGPALLADLLARSKDPGQYLDHWRWARLIVVESDRKRLVICPYLFRHRSDLLAIYQKLDQIVSQLMLLNAPRAGVRAGPEGGDE